MTQSVDQTSITDVTSRRHNDPPGLWIAVVTSSVALHLVLFWLMRYNNPFSLWFPQPNQAIIPIEVIEISPSSSKAKPPKPQVKAKTVSPPSANQQSSTVTPRNENSGGINFSAIRKQRERNNFVSKSNTQLVPKQSVSTPNPIFTPIPTTTPTQSQPISEDSPIPSRRTPRQPISEDSPIPSRRTPQPTAGAGTIAILRFLTPDELTPDEQRTLNPDPLPKGSILPKHIGSDEKLIDSISLKPNLDLPEKEFLVSLVIDQTGNFVQAEVVDRAIAPKERPKYQEFANSVFRGEKFQLARYPNGTPVLKLVNRLVRIKIQRR